MALITWQEFSRRPEIKSLPLCEQKKQFLWENQRRAEENWFLEMQVAGANGNGFSGIGIDGPIAGATVASSAGVTTTNALGEFTFASTPVGPITITGGTDSITGVAFEGELVGYAEYKTISPITTVAHYIKEESSLTIDEAVTKVFASSSALFGIELPVESKDIVLQRDYIKEAVVNNNRTGIAAQAVATYLEGVTETLGETLVRNAVDLNEKNQFADGKGKSKSYRAIGRQIVLDNRLDPSTLNNRVKYDEIGKFGEKTELEGREIANYSAISSQLTNLRNSLRTKVDEQQYTTNYLTSQIQAFNKAQKTTIKQEIKDAVNTAEFGFTDIEEAKSNAESDLKQIEAGKENETKPVVDSKVSVYAAPDSAFSQKGGKGLEVTFKAGVFNDLTAVRTVAYFGNSLQGSTLYKQVETKLGIGYQNIFMKVDGENLVTATTINANEYVNIKVTDTNKNAFTILAKPQPLLDKRSVATLTAASIEKREVKEQEPEEKETDHIVTEKTATYSIAELIDGSYTKETTEGVSRGGTDAVSGLPTLEIEYSSFLFKVSENFDPPAKGENAVGKEIFTVTDISKESGLGQLVTGATFVKDEGSTTERLIFSFQDAKKVKRTFRITYTTLS